MTKDKLLYLLHAENAVRVIFEKKDGTERVMVATLKENMIPEDKKPKGTGKAQPTGSPIVRAFDVELGEFRSINTAALTSVALTDGVNWVMCSMEDY